MKSPSDFDLLGPELLLQFARKAPTASTAGPKGKCLLCETVIQSMYRHDYVTCKCGNFSLDGGSSYVKINYRTADSYVLLDT